MMVNKKSSIRKKSQGDYQKGYVSSAKRGVREKLFLALAVLMLCACSSDDELESTFNGANATGGVTYLTINLREVGSSTRASDGGYASSSTEEHNVANAYFYFYDNDGNYIARGNVGATEGTSSTTESSTTSYIEWNSNTVVEVDGLEEGNFPTKMVTVVNQPSGFNASHLTLEEMITKLAGTPYADASGNFVMSTSVYEDGGASAGQEIVNTTTLSSSNFATDDSATPVEVYVERLAAKVEVSLDESLTQPIPITITNAGSTSLASGVNVQLLGWDVNGTARDAYIVKQVQSSWIVSSGAPFTGWNGGPSAHRCYWAESPNYGDTETIYPTSSNGNIDDDEANASTWLNPYLKYTSLETTNNFGTGYAYCGENTNTTAVLGDASSTALTNVLVKAQAGTYTDETFTPIDLVEYGGSYYTVEDFCQECVDGVKFVDIIDGAITALESEGEYSSLYDDLEALKEAAANGSVYKTSISDANPTATTSFGGEMLSLYNAYDGNVTIGYNITSDSSENYSASDIVYPATTDTSKPADLNNYDFWFSVDPSGLTDYIDDLTKAGLLVSIGENYYIPLNTTITFTEQSVFYTMRSYFLSALAADAATTNSSFGTIYPNYYNKGMMYYSVPIEHLGSAGTNGSLGEGQYGVVRNHWYDISINSIASMGRGIAVEDEVIVPIGDNGIQTNSIGASTKIYSWKEYDQTVIF